jgi:secreted PhoX family phosphatase
VFGAGFAAVDNLAFDRQGNLWGVTDMSTGLLNGFSEGVVPAVLEIDHSVTGGAATAPNLIGVFGNNWLFVVPVRGTDAGKVIPVAYGPTRCEMTGPTFVDDTLIISVQHPSEDVPINEQGTPPLTRDIEMLGLDGVLFTQQRTVPVGSNWPSNLSSNTFGPPRPCTIGIRRVDGFGFADIFDGLGKILDD